MAFKILDVEIRLSTVESLNPEGIHNEYARVSFSTEYGCRLVVSGSGLEPADLKIIQEMVQKVVGATYKFPNLEKRRANAAKDKHTDDDEDFDDEDFDGEEDDDY